MRHYFSYRCSYNSLFSWYMAYVEANPDDQIVLVSISEHWICSDDYNGDELAKARLDLDKGMFIDPLPSCLVDQCAAEKLAEDISSWLASARP